MTPDTRPYLIIPKLIQQPTWGGTKIIEAKGWQNLSILSNKKIGQSYELFSGTKLSLLTDTNDAKFIPEIGFPDKNDILLEEFPLKEGDDYIYLSSLNQVMPLLIKINHARGNSFQLHIKSGVADARWKPKAESWYYFEPGYLTFGIKKGINLDEYKETCLKIEDFMKSLSQKVKSSVLDIETARAQADDFIKQNDPHKFVNFYESKQYEVIDPSLGGIHHSWEEDLKRYPDGNFLYEVQEDVMDPVSTIRSFDQGKIKEDGTIREINIDDYFKYLDTDEAHNDVSQNKQQKSGERVLTTAKYCMDEIALSTEREFNVGNSFEHLFVRDGGIKVVSSGIELTLSKGFSCFIPTGVKTYNVLPTAENTVVLKTYLP